MSSSDFGKPISDETKKWEKVIHESTSSQTDAVP